MIEVLRHESFEHLGYFSEILLRRGISFRYNDLGESLDAAFQSVLGSGSVPASGLIVMGGPQSANDPDPGLRAELRLIEAAVARHVPVLGICLGAQLLAKALGGAVHKNPEKEIGWSPVYFTPAASGDPLLGGLPSPTTFFHWHGETFTLPGGAEWLAYSDKCRNQAFRYGRSAYGIQFHPEITPEMIADWCAQPANCGDVADLQTPVDPRAYDTSALAVRVLDGWLALGASRG